MDGWGDGRMERGREKATKACDVLDRARPGRIVSAPTRRDEPCLAGRAGLGLPAWPGEHPYFLRCSTGLQGAGRLLRLSTSDRASIGGAAEAAAGRRAP